MAETQTPWSNIVKQQPPQPHAPIHHAPPPPPPTCIPVGSCRSSTGVAVAVVDANAVINGGERLSGCSDKFVTVNEVLSEVRDPNSRRRLEFLPFEVETVEPTPESLKKVISFARATGDLQTLSDVDLKLIALTYTLEAQIHGTSHIRDCPPPMHTVNVKRLPEKDLPGWGSNVPNLAEWEALEQTVGDGSNGQSRILPLRDLNLNIPTDKDQSENSSLANGAEPGENQVDDVAGFYKPGKFLPKKKEVNIEGKKNVADGIDASQGQDVDDAGDWLPAVGRSTHRRYLRRKARREMNDASSDATGKVGDEDLIDDKCPELVMDEHFDEVTLENSITEEKSGDELGAILNQMRLEEDVSLAHEEGEVLVGSNEGLESSELKQVDATHSDRELAVGEVDEDGTVNEGLEELENSSQPEESVDGLYVDDSSEQSWRLRSLSESSVACITSDFAMQNVLLQMGLRLLAPGGMQIRELHRWILRCHACFKVTTEIGKIFCPSCGNGGTLRKVAVTVGENGVVVKARRPRVSVRGTKFSLPLPQGGRDAITKNPILREDQLPRKFLHPKTKKKAKDDDDIFAATDMFIHHTDKKAPLQPPVRKAVAVFSGKRNPNDNHYSRSRH